MKTALIAGSTGLVGSELIKTLAQDDYYDRIRVLSRRALPMPDNRFEGVIVPDFDKLAAHRDRLAAEDVFCCLGTTMKKAGGKTNFRKVDLEYPMALADIALENGAKRFFLVSAMGADRGSFIFYNRIKGEVEAETLERPFEAILIFRPSLLLGERNEKRMAETIGQNIASLLSGLWRGRLRKYEPVKATDVAQAMANTAKRSFKGANFFDSAEIHDLAIEQEPVK